MSLAAIRAAFEVVAGGPAAKLVLLALANRANSEGRTWPSVAVIAADTELHVRSIHRAIKVLVDAGLLEVIHRNGRPSVYVVLPMTLCHTPLTKTTKTYDTVSPEPIRNRSRTAQAASAPVENPSAHDRYFMPGSGWIEDFTTRGANGVHP